MYSEEELDDLLFDDYENENYEVVLSKMICFLMIMKTKIMKLYYQN